MARATVSDHPTALEQQLLQSLLMAISFSVNDTDSPSSNTSDPSHPSSSIVLALSGGLDSMVLLEAMSRLLQQDQTPLFALRAVHVNHQLQSEANDWAEFCRQQCQQRQIPIDVVEVDLSQSKGSLEAAARRARYQALQQLSQANDQIFSAHHQDDQVETMLMRWLRASQQWWISERRPLTSASNIQLVRPLLEFSRRQLEQLAHMWQLTWVEDPSNKDTRFERNWWRQQGLPMLRQQYPSLLKKLNRSRQRAEFQTRLIDQLVEPYYQEAIQHRTYLDGQTHWPGEITGYLPLQMADQWTDELLLSLIQRWQRDVWRDLDCTEADPWSHGEYQTLIQQIRSQADQAIYWPRCWGRIAIWRQGIYAISDQVFELSPTSLPIVSYADLQITEIMSWAGGQLMDLPQAWQYQQQPISHGTCFILSAGQLAEPSMSKLKPLSRPTKTFKHIFQERKVPPWLRANWPTLVRAPSKQDIQDSRVSVCLGLIGLQYHRDCIPLSEFICSPRWSRVSPDVSGCH